MTEFSQFTFAAAISLTAFVSIGGAALANDRLFSNVSLGVGAFAFVGPSYEGSNEFSIAAIPIAFPVFKPETDDRARVKFGGLDNVRVSVFRRGGFDIGPIVGYSFGRDEDLSDNLTGLGNVDGGLVLGGFSSFTFGQAFVEAGLSAQVTGGSDNGFIADIGAGYTMEVLPRVSLTGRVGTQYASQDYMDRYFSVSAAQADASTQGYRAFVASSGIKNISATLSLNFDASERLSLRASTGYSRLIGDAADSPISEADNQFSGGAGFIFKF